MQLRNHKLLLPTSKGAQKGMHQHIPPSKMIFYDTFQTSFLATIKAQGLIDVADPDFDLDDGDNYEQELFQEKQFFVYSVLVTSLQTDKGRELVKEFEGMQDPSFQNFIITILSQMLHNLKLSL